MRLFILAVVFVCSQTFAQRAIFGGTPDERAYFASFNRSNIFWETGEYHLEEGLLVFVSKAPGDCRDPLLEYSRVDPEVWHGRLRILDTDADDDSRNGGILVGRRMIMVTQAPAGASCGWRVFPKGGVEWSSVTEMKRTRVIGSCAEAVEAITKAGASKELARAVLLSLRHPKTAALCERQKDQVDAGPK